MDWSHLKPPDEQTRFDEAVDSLIRAMAIKPEAAMKVMLNKFVLAARLLGLEERNILMMVQMRYQYSVKKKEER